jgi:hypothetical protein
VEESSAERYLGNLGQQIKLHWEKYRPAMYRQLEQSGKLDQALLQAREQTSDALHSLLRQGVPYHQAWESVREEWAFLPSEADQPLPKPED